jgi:hypothetical protein
VAHEDWDGSEHSISPLKNNMQEVYFPIESAASEDILNFGSTWKARVGLIIRRFNIFLSGGLAPELCGRPSIKKQINLR